METEAIVQVLNEFLNALRNGQVREELLYPDEQVPPEWEKAPPLSVVVRHEGGLYRLTRRPLRLYSQRDPRWAAAPLGDTTIGKAGCYITCVAMLASLAGYSDTPDQTLAKLMQAGAMSGPLLLYPERIPTAYPKLEWRGRLDYRNVPADVDRVRRELASGPTIIEVDFDPRAPGFNQHFVLGLGFVDDDIEIADPWDGHAKLLLRSRYAFPKGGLARAIHGLRLLRVRPVC